MTPEEAIEVLSNELIVITDMIGYCRDFEKESDLALAYRVKRREAHKIAISALKEIQQYRGIGTVDECKLAMEYWNYLRRQRCGVDGVVEKCMEYEQIGSIGECKMAVEKQIPKKPKEIDEEYGYFICGNCGGAIGFTDDFKSHKYCLNCGQAIDENLEGMEDE